MGDSNIEISCKNLNGNMAYIFLTDSSWHHVTYLRYIKPLHRILQGKKFNSINKKGDDIKHRNRHIPLISRRGGDGNHLSSFRRSWSRRRNPFARYIYNNSNSETVLSPYDESLILLVDFKCDPNLSAKLLDKSIELLKPYLSRVEQGKFVKGKMTVVISGNRPKNRFLFSTTGTTAKSNNQTSFFRGGGSDGGSGADLEIDAIRGKFSWQQNLIRRFSQPIVNNDNDDLTRYMFLDGRIGDLNTEQDSELVPLVSFDWKMIQLFRYFNGNSEEFMKRIADRAHSQGKRMRIWGAPNTEQCWSSMLKSNVDWLSVDDHERFTEFATQKSRLLKLE